MNWNLSNAYRRQIHNSTKPITIEFQNIQEYSSQKRFILFFCINIENGSIKSHAFVVCLNIAQNTILYANSTAKHIIILLGISQIENEHCAYFTAEKSKKKHIQICYTPHDNVTISITERNKNCNVLQSDKHAF